MLARTLSPRANPRGRPLLFIGALLAGCNQAPEPIDRSADAVLNGVDDTTDTAVIAVDTLLPAGEELCTGFLIMPDLVLTARHCAAPVVDPTGGCVTKGTLTLATGGPPLAPTKIFAYAETILSASSKPLAVAEVTVLPGSVGQSMCGNDLAILRLQAPLDGVAPLAMSLSAPPAVGDMFTAIGYGLPSPTDVNGGDRRRSRSGLLVASIGASTRTSDGEWIADTGPCAGDSGSPAIGADGTAIGVMVRGPKSTCVSMIYERVDVHADFLIEQVKASAVRLGVAVPPWAGGQGGAGGSGGAGGAGGAPSKTPQPSNVSEGCSLGASNGPASSGGATAALLVLGLITCIRRAGGRAPMRRRIDPSGALNGSRG